MKFFAVFATLAVLFSLNAHAETDAGDVAVIGVGGTSASTGSLTATILSPTATVQSLLGSLTPADEAEIAREIQKELVMYDASEGKIIGTNMQNIIKQLLINPSTTVEQAIAAIRAWVTVTLDKK